jgi:hypothetical protein
MGRRLSPVSRTLIIMAARKWHSLWYMLLHYPPGIVSSSSTMRHKHVTGRLLPKLLVFYRMCLLHSKYRHMLR